MSDDKDMELAEPTNGDERGLRSPAMLADQDILVSLLEAMPGGAAFINRDLRYVYANQQFLDFFQLPEERLIGRHASEIYPEAAYPAFRAFAERALSGETARMEGPSFIRGGETFVRQSYTPYFGADGNVKGMIVLGFDLTEMKRQERQIADQARLQADNEALNKAIVDTALDCIIIIDEDSNVVDFNPAAERTLGYRREEAIGRDIAELIIPRKYRDAHRAGMKRFMATGKSKVIGRRVEVEAMRADGSEIPAELAIGEVTAGGRRLFTAHIRDLSEARASAREIERQRESIHQKEKLAALGSLLSGVAHELNNPLSIVIGQTMMLREKASKKDLSADELGDLVERSVKIETAANRCARIVKSFLAMARQRQAERKQVDVAKLIKEAVELLAYGLRTSDVGLDVRVESDLPPLLADGDQLHQVLVNLIVNARQSLEEVGGDDRKIAIEARADRERGQLLIHVRDNGPGISPSIHSRIFDPFFTTKSQDHGTGIGLAVSRGLIEAHGGTLELADPQPEKGAEFVITLPLAIAGSSDIAEGTVKATGDRIVQNKRRILVIDDEFEIASLIADILENLGYEAVIAQSGKAAQQILTEASTPIAAILCDIRMPDGDGPALFDWLTANMPSLCSRIGFVTGDTLGPSAGRFLARSGCPVIEKPFTPSDLSHVLAELLEPAAGK